jgi:hypothetical protein
MIDSQIVVDNAGLHAAQTVHGQIELAAGLHSIK